MDDPDPEPYFENAAVLVTGGAGFIGSHLAERLVGVGADVTVLDDLSAGRERNLDPVTGEIEFVEGDVRDREAVAGSVSETGVVFHLAANAHVPTSVERPRYDFEVNALGTQTVLEAAVDAGVDRVVNASSAAVYGPPEQLPIPETHPQDPISPYGASKLAGEKLGRAYHASYGLDARSVRIFNTYGPRQPRYVMFDFLRKLDEDPSELAVLGSGKEVRTFVYVSDAVDALLAVAAVESAGGEVYNVGGEDAIEIIDLAELMAERYAEGPTDVFATGESKQGDIETLVADNSKLAGLGVEPAVPLEDGLDALYEWYRGSAAATGGETRDQGSNP